MDSVKLKDNILEILDDQKAIDVALLNVKELTDVTDWFVICTGRSNRHTKAIADKLIERMKELGEVPLSVEGKETGYWILLDFIDVVIHVMQAEARDFYEIEKLWTQSEIEPINHS